MRFPGSLLAERERFKQGLSVLTKKLGMLSLRKKLADNLPGTKWCGAGDVARDYDDLGPKAETDKCCRDHDNSIESMARGEEKNGLKNTLLYTM